MSNPGGIVTEAEGHRVLVQNGVLPDLAGGDWTGRCDLMPWHAWRRWEKRKEGK